MKMLTEKIHGISLIFFNRKIEADFYNYMYKSNLGLYRLSLLSFMAMDFLYIFLDELAIGHQSNLMPYRALLLLPYLLLIYFLTGKPGFQKVNEFFSSALVLGHGGLVLVAWNTSAPAFQYMVPGVMMFNIAGYFLMSTRFRYAVISCWLNTLITIYLASRLVDENPAVLNATLSILLGNSVLLTLAKYLNERMVRASYIQKLAIERFEQSRYESSQSRLHWLENFAQLLKHELRTYVSGIGTSLEVLRLKKSYEEKHITTSQSNLRRINRLLERVVEANDMESVILEEEETIFDLDQMIRANFLLYMDIYPQFKFTYEGDEPTYLRGKKDGVSLLINNLVANATEFTDDGGEIYLSLHNKVSYALLKVRNHGQKLADTEKIFNLFSTLRDAGEDKQHLGIGLYIVKIVAELHNGGVSATSLVDPEGAEFTVRLDTLGMRV